MSIATSTPEACARSSRAFSDDSPRKSTRRLFPHPIYL